MTRMIHFAKVFAIVWVLLSVVYIVVVLRVGFGVHLPGSPPKWLLWLVFYAWPAIPAAFVAASWELVRMIRRN
jgi:hypothetical protein